MNREDIIRMANESNLLGIYADEAIDSVIRFATLVASAERERIKQANAPEIERVNAHIKELEDACKKPEQEPVAWKYDVTHNQDGTVSVTLPDGDELRIVLPNQQEPYCWTWDEFVSGGKWRAEYGWKKPTKKVVNLQPLYTIPPQPWEKFCDSNCVWTDHHPDCKLAEQHQDWCASLTQMLMSMPPKPAPCNCKPKPEPMAWTNKMSIDVPNQPLYTAPQRTWVGLTLDERIELAQDVDWAAGAYCEYAEKIEAKLKELNT